jgi:hypothetical protein
VWVWWALTNIPGVGRGANLLKGRALSTITSISNALKVIGVSVPTQTFEDETLALDWLVK